MSSSLSGPGRAEQVEIARWKKSTQRSLRLVKYGEIIADNLSRAGWSWGCVATIDSSGRTIFVATHTATTERDSSFAPTRS